MRGCILIVARTRMDYPFPTGNENLLFYQHSTHFILPSEFLISVHIDTNCPSLVNYENATNQPVCIPPIFY